MSRENMLEDIIGSLLEVLCGGDCETCPLDIRSACQEIEYWKE